MHEPRNILTSKHIYIIFQFKVMWNVSCYVAITYTFNSKFETHKSLILLTSQWNKHTSVLPNLRFRRPIGLLLTSAPRPAKPYRYFATLGHFWLPGCKMSWNWAPLWKIVNFLSIQGDSEPFQRQWADVSSIDRIKTLYGAIEGDYPQLPELNNLLLFCPIGWFLVNLPHKCPKLDIWAHFCLTKNWATFRLSIAVAGKIYRGLGLWIFGNTDIL